LTSRGIDRAQSGQPGGECGVRGTVPEQIGVHAVHRVRDQTGQLTGDRRCGDAHGGEERPFHPVCDLGQGLGGRRMSPDHGLGLIYQLRGSRTAVPDVASDLAAAATRANATVGSGRGPVHGSRVHTAFRQEILALGRSDVFSEISYLNGRVVP
jgi:hypothetical protein